MSNISEEVTLHYKYLTSMFASVFGNEMAHQMASRALASENEDKFDEFMFHILDLSKPEHQRLYCDSKAVRFGRKIEEFSEEEKQLIRQTIEDKEREIHFRLGGWADESAAATADIEEKRKKTKKLTKLHVSELQRGYLKQGRVPCECQATEHKLINNCIECGRVVCEQEGSGPCFYCDSMVVTPEELEILDSNTKQAGQLYNALMDRKKSDDWKKMIERRDKLITFDEQFSSRTKIVDEDEDYFDVNNKWLSEKQRKKIKEHNEKEKERQEQTASRLNKPVKYTFDVERRRAIEEREEKFVFKPLPAEELESDDDYDDTGERRPKMPDVTSLIEAMKSKCGTQLGVRDEPNDPKRVFLEEIRGAAKIDDEYGPDDVPTILDPMYTSSLDFGQCLSMHQPWASLLVHGIKKVEGRDWPTDHRGRLWIASTAKPPEKDDIDGCERFYKQYFEGTNVAFPKVYPTSSLLGSVFVQDCLDHEDYGKMPGRELDGCSYYFLCESPRTLPFPLPILGKPKIYTLPLDLHKTARKALGLKKNSRGED